ncbi:MAG TPA: hypothetical protein VMU39_28290, partial [Solirubrobacteraceae bacterium]|nr:hypothetical protein [Solirubrobacteraceae bacterium]
MLAIAAAGAHAPALAGALVFVTIGLVLDSRRWVRLAGRSRVGARSEDEVQRALAQLATEGWRLRHSLPWRGRGDIDSVAIAPTGVAFAIVFCPVVVVVSALRCAICSGGPRAFCPGVRPPGLLHSLGGVQSSVGG